MDKQKGQGQIIILLIAIIGIVVFFVFSEPSEKKTPRSSSPSQPVFQQESVISPLREEAETSSSPNLVLDNTPPYRSNPQPAGKLPAQTRKTSISLKTNEEAICRYDTVSGIYYEYMQHTFTETGSTYHSTSVTTLSEGMGYVYYVRCIDKHGNENTDDFIISFSVEEPEDLTPPVRSNQYPTGDILAAGTTKTIIAISTNEPAYCRYDTEQGRSYSSMRRSLGTDSIRKYHTATVSGLTTGNTYNYFVRCKDLKGNVNTGDVMIYFSVGE